MMVQNINNDGASIGAQVNFGNIDATNLTGIDLDDLFKAPEREQRTRSVYLWVTDSVADKVQEYQDDLKKREEIILDFLKDGEVRIKREVKYIQECLNFYKTLTDDLKEGFKKVQKEFEDSISEIYEETEEDYVKMCKRNIDFLNKIKNSSVEVKNTVTEIKNSLDKVDIYGADKLLEVVEKFSYMSDKEKELLSKLLNTELK